MMGVLRERKEMKSMVCACQPIAVRSLFGAQIVSFIEFKVVHQQLKHLSRVVGN